MSVLNAALYQALQREFGHVGVVHAGQAMQAIYLPGPTGRLRMAVISAGEYYTLSCPY